MSCGDEDGDDFAGGLDSHDAKSVFNLSIQEAYSSLDSRLVDDAEIENMLTYEVWEPLEISKVDASVRQQAMFLKEKLTLLAISSN